MNKYSNLTTQSPQDWQVPSFETRLWDGRRYPWCVVIPVINEGNLIKNLLVRMSLINIHMMADIIIIDGGSCDGSLDINMLKEFEVRALLIKTGPGKLSAQLRCAYAFALNHGYEGVVTIDGNNKDDPEAIPNFIAKLKDGIDFIQGSRFISGGIAVNTPKARNLAIRLLHAPFLSFASGFKWTDTTQGFRGYSRKILLDPNISLFRNVFSTYELLAYLSYKAPRLGYKCIELPTIREYPKGKVPTKINSFRGYISLLAILVSACFGRFDPINLHKNKELRAKDR